MEPEYLAATGTTPSVYHGSRKNWRYTDGIDKKCATWDTYDFELDFELNIKRSCGFIRI